MTIILQPETICFLGNLNDIVLGDIAGEISFTLKLGNAILVDERYWPENGKVRIRIKDLVEEYLHLYLPAVENDLVMQSEAVQTFEATINGSQKIVFTVVKGGIGDISEVSTVFMKTQWLTLQPQRKEILINQPEWLSYYAIIAARVKIKAYFSDHSSEKIVAELNANTLSTINMSYGNITAKFGSGVGYYDAWVEDTEGNRLTYVQRYVLQQVKGNERIYVFENTLGGFDTVIFRGKFTERIKTEGTIVTVLEEDNECDVDFTFSSEQNTGYIPSVEYARWLRGFFVSKQRYYVSDGFRQIYLRESENGYEVGGLSSYSFEFFYSVQTKYGYAIRNEEELPALLEFPEVDDLPFLAPRLVEFPIAAIADDLMLPAQFAWENKWRRISIAAIIQSALGNVTDALDKIDLTNYWKKTELIRDGLYLKFLEEKIKAGYADEAGNAKLWEKNKFSEWLDQAVRRGDDVVFNSLKSFKDKWGIDAEGIAKLIGAIISGDVKSDNFLAGALGTGYGLLKYDQDGKSYLEIDKLFVRLKAIFAVLEIRKLTYAGGNFIFSPAGMDCVSVEEYDTYYRCYFTADDGSSAVENTFEVDDLVRMQEFNIKAGVHENVSNRYFWRRCVGKGENYIDLSKTDRDLSSDDAPQAGDSLVTMGNKTITSRQNVIMISVYGEGSPSFIQYTGINDYSLDGKAKTIISPELNQLTGKFVFSTSGKDVETAITDAVDGVQIGGRNLILNSKLDNSDGWYLNNGGTIVEFGGYKCLKTHGNKSGMYLIYTSENAVNIPQSGKIVSSVDVYATESTVIFLGRGRSENSSINITETNKWIRVYNVQNLTAVNDSYIIYNGGDSVVYFKNVKCEIGNKATDWTPAPEDTESEITTLKEQSAEFETSINGLTSRVEATETTVQGTREDLDNLQIGGRNYIKNSRLDNLTGWGVWSATSNVVELDGVKCVKIIASYGGIYAPFNILNLLYNLVADTNNLYVTSSVDIYSDKQINVDLGIERNDGTKYVLNETNKWVRISTTQKINSEPHAFIIYPRDTTATVYVKNAKLEIGNKATDWTPAPEDLETKIEENKSLIDQKADEISLSVSQEIINKKGNGNNIAICETESIVINGGLSILKDTACIGKVFTLSVEKTNAIEQTGLDDHLLVYSSGTGGETLEFGRFKRTSDVKQTLTFTVPSNSAGTIYLRVDENWPAKTEVTNLKLEYGDTATVWTPSVKDQEKYVDNKTYTETILDLTGSQFDQSKYYPVTIEITAYNVPIEITVTSPLGRDYGVPGWSELGGGFSCEARWTVNNTNVMGVDLNSYIKRNIERFQYDFTEEDAVNGGKVIPLGSIGNLMWNPYEYVYLRGGAKYKFLITNNLVPVLHETDATIFSEYLWIKTSVEVPQITNVNREEYNAEVKVLSDRITATSSKVDNVSSQVAQLTVKYDNISGIVTSVDSRLGVLEKAGFIVESDFVSIFVEKSNELGTSIVNSINFSPEGITIDANKIVISGETKFVDDAGNAINIFGTGDDVFVINGGVFKVDKTGRLTSTAGNIAGWEIKSTCLRSSIFEYPTIDSTGDRLAGGSGSLLSPDGGLMLIPTGSGILAPSTGLMQAGLIRAWGSNAAIIGLEIDAKQTNSNFGYNHVVALRLIASHANSNPSVRPSAIEIVDGDIVMTGNTIINGLGLKVRTISSSSGSITKEDDIVFVSYTSSVTLSLPTPSAVKTGKMIFIRKTGTGNVTINGRIMKSWTNIDSSVSLNNGKLMVFINQGNYWTQNTIGGEW